MILLNGPRTAGTQKNAPVKTTVKDEPRRKLLEAGAKSRAMFPSQEVYKQNEVPAPQE